MDTTFQISKERTTIRVDRCSLCHSKGVALYSNLSDRLFHAKGEWNLMRCPEEACGLIWLHPMPSQNHISDAYEGYYTHHHNQVNSNSKLRQLYTFLKKCYFDLRFGYEQIHPALRLFGLVFYLHPLQRAAIDLDVMFLTRKKNGRLLDIGCGNGKRLLIMRYLGWQVEGLDFDPAAVEIGRQNGLTIHLGALKQQHFPNDYFDAITMSHVIEHLHEPELIIRECFRILKPEGQLIIVTPNIDSWSHKMYGNAWVHLDPPRHLFLFSPKTLRSLAESMPFKSIDTKTILHCNDITFDGSESIRKINRYSIDGPQPLYHRIRARVMEYIEYLLLKFKPSSGDEIVLIAKK